MGRWWWWRRRRRRRLLLLLLLLLLLPLWQRRLLLVHALLGGGLHLSAAQILRRWGLAVLRHTTCQQLARIFQHPVDKLPVFVRCCC